MSRPRLAAILVLVFLAGAALFAFGGYFRMSEDPIVAFARDFSGNDTEIVEKAKGFVVHPPTDIETVGFYGVESTPARQRALLSTVTLLDNEEKFTSVEDKYSYEIFPVWQEMGLVDPATLPPTAKRVFGPLFEGWWPGQEDSPDAAYVEAVWNDYAQATRELEEHMRSRGKALLSIDATDGDTMFFAAVAPDIADRWRDRSLGGEGVYVSGVRAPMWDRFWDHMDYAAGPYFSQEGRSGLPPGTPTRKEELPPLH